ncbi:MAG: Fe-S cluster assembly protein SufB [Erysipelotrichaceae bacterium]|nr:Fe-S cluster assembly protein SufB [Erysipelotrichaceae bacterium]
MTVKEENQKIIDSQENYRYGFKNEDVSVFSTGKGLSEEIVREISAQKGEPEWMLEYRLQAYRKFLEMPTPTWGVDLSEVDYDDFTYYIKPSAKVESNWEDVPETIKNTFAKLKIPEAEQKFLSGVSTQYESEAVYQSMLQEARDAGIIFLDTDSGLREYPELFKEYFGTVIPYTDNKFSALNSAVWSGGSFIYVPKGVKLDKPLQSYFRINSERMGQFERTLIIVDEGSDIHYIEGCTAPLYAKDSLHAGVVEIVVKKGAKMRYSTVQNWSTNILNLVTQRATVEANGIMEWVDGNVGSHLNMKYPCCILKGEGAKGVAISVAVGSHNQFQDNGAKMIHLAPYTSSTIISKSLCRAGGRVNYRGLVNILPKAHHSHAKVSCDTLIIDGESGSDTYPTNIVDNDSSTIEHEATVSKISEEQLYYLMSRGLSEEEATQMIILGFIEPFTKELPMEYAVELNQLLKMNMEGSVG